MPELRLYHSRRKARRFIERHGVEFKCIDGADAQTWFFADDTGRYAVVLMDAGTGREYWEDMGIIAHEATHIMRFALSDIGEEEPGEEEMCYAVQAVAMRLCEGHFAWKERKMRERLES